MHYVYRIDTVNNLFILAGQEVDNPLYPDAGKFGVTDTTRCAVCEKLVIKGWHKEALDNKTPVYAIFVNEAAFLQQMIKVDDFFGKMSCPEQWEIYDQSGFDRPLSFKSKKKQMFDVCSYKCKKLLMTSIERKVKKWLKEIKKQMLDEKKINLNKKLMRQVRKATKKGNRDALRLLKKEFARVANLQN